MRCKGLCCPLGGTCSEYLYKNGCNRCWCCFNPCFSFTNEYLIDIDLKSEEKYAQIEEWFRKGLIKLKISLFSIISRIPKRKPGMSGTRSYRKILFAFHPFFTRTRLELGTGMLRFDKHPVPKSSLV